MKGPLILCVNTLNYSILIAVNSLLLIPTHTSALLLSNPLYENKCCERPRETLTRRNYRLIIVHSAEADPCHGKISRFRIIIAPAKIGFYTIEERRDSNCSSVSACYA